MSTDPSMRTPYETRAARGDAPAVTAAWARRCGLPIAILAWTGVVLLLLWLLGHVLQALLLLTLAAVLAYALAPAVTLLARLMPRPAAILAVYLVVLGVIISVLYLIVTTAIVQFVSLGDYLRFLLTPSTTGQLTPLEQGARSFGVSPEQLVSARDQVVTTIQGFADRIVPLLTSLAGGVFDVVLVAVLSIYLLIDGERVFGWLRQNMPHAQQGRMRFLLDTLQRVVGGYLRGQLLLCALLGVLVGVGMWVVGVPYALLLGVLAFIFGFIPVVGTFASGGLCVLLALSRGWVTAAVVLGYFVVVHIIEGDVVGPRIVGKSIGLHPVVALTALLVGAELFGIGGALFASPVAGILQAFLVTIWAEWRTMRPHEFPPPEPSAALDAAAEEQQSAEPPPKLLS